MPSRSSSFTDSAPTVGSLPTSTSSGLLGGDEERVVGLAAIDDLHLGARAGASQRLARAVNALDTHRRAEVQRQEARTLEAARRLAEDVSFIRAVGHQLAVEERDGVAGAHLPSVDGAV